MNRKNIYKSLPASLSVFYLFFILAFIHSPLVPIAVVGRVSKVLILLQRLPHCLQQRLCRDVLTYAVIHPQLRDNTTLGVHALYFIGH